MLSSLVTSAGIAMAFNLAATASRRSTLRDATITSAPSRLASSAVARPIPEEPPTTTTFLPASIMPSPLFCGFGDVSTRHCEERQRRSNPVLLCRSGLLRSARNDAERMPSGRIESGSNARLALPESRKLPNAGAAGIDIGGDIDIDQIGLVGGDALANGFAEIAGAIDPHAFDAAGARHGGEVRIVTRAGGRIMEVGGEFAAAEVTALQPADRGVSVVVPDHPNHGQIIFDRRSQHVGMHEERAVAAYRYAGTIRCCELRAHHAGNAEPHR